VSLDEHVGAGKQVPLDNTETGLVDFVGTCDGALVVLEDEVDFSTAPHFGNG